MTLKTFSYPGGLHWTQRNTTPGSPEQVDTGFELRPVQTNYFLSSAPNKGNHRTPTAYWFHSERKAALAGTQIVQRSDFPGHEYYYYAQGVFRDIDISPPASVPGWEMNIDTQRIFALACSVANADISLKGKKHADEHSNIDPLVSIGEMPEIRKNGQQLLQLTREFVATGIRGSSIRAIELAMRRVGGPTWKKGIRHQELKQFRADVIRHTPQWDRNFAALYLNYSLSVAPIVSDTAEILDGIKTRRSYTKIPFRGYGEGQVEVDYVLDGWSRFWRRKYIVALKGEYTLFSDPIGQHMADYGIRNAIDVVRLGWELTPLSWLCDYAFNVGNYLDSLATAIHLGNSNIAVSGRVAILDVMESRESIDRSVDSPTGYSRFNARGYGKRVMFTRRPINSYADIAELPPTPTFRIPDPRSGKSRDSNAWLMAGSLLRVAAFRT